MTNDRQSFGDKFKKLDHYAQQVKFNFDGGRTFFQTKRGALVSLINILIVLAFAVSRFIIMIGRDNNNIYQHQEFDENLISISSENGFTFAFGISTFADKDTSTDQSLDFGTLVAQYEKWDLTSRTFEPIATRPCQLSDFGIDDQTKLPD